MIILLLIIFIFVIAAWLTMREGSNRNSSSEPPNQLPELMKLPAESRSAFIVCTFSMLGKLAQADGTVSEAEEKKVKQYVEKTLLLDRKTSKLALEVFQNSASSPLELRDYAEKFRDSYPDRVQLCDSMIEILVELSVADGVLSPNEDQLIRSAALLLGLTEAGYRRIKDKFVTAEQLLH